MSNPGAARPADGAPRDDVEPIRKRWLEYRHYGSVAHRDIGFLLAIVDRFAEEVKASRAALSVGETPREPRRDGLLSPEEIALTNLWHAIANEHGHGTIAKRIDEYAEAVRVSVPGPQGEERRERGCPCEWVKPCSADCTCANSVMSGGCNRCCKYGSNEQRKAAALDLASRDKVAISPATPDGERRAEGSEAAVNALWCEALLPEGSDVIQRVTTRVLALRAAPPTTEET